MLCRLRTRAVYVVAAVVVFALATPCQALRKVKVGEPAPPFSVKADDGLTLTGDAYKGKVLLLLFVKPSHPNSLKMLKTAQEILNENPDTKLRILGVSTARKKEAGLAGLSKEHRLTFPIVGQPSRKMYGDFGVLVVPTALLIDEEGVLRHEQAHVPPGYGIHLRLHADLLLGKINQEQLEARLAETKSRKPKSEVSQERRLAFARSLLDDGKLEEAVALLTRLMSEHSSPLTAGLLADCYLRLGKVDAAARCLEPFAGQGSLPASVKLVLARLEARRGDDKKAERHLLEALEKSPRKDRILFELGRLYERQGQPTKALSCYRRALEDIYGVDK
ncbi:MAG: tetratricopeptide repeat protein [Phycisphaerae bacterium]|nr:tetratricopeptide repeat protein [Phycisphaerae bacterium]